MPNPWESFSPEQSRQWEAVHDQGPEGFRLKLKRAALWDVIRRHLPADKSAPVLELGAGTGVWGLKLAELGYRVEITDVSAGMLQVAERKAEQANLAQRVHVERVDMTFLGRYADGMFPLVLAVGAPLSYAQDPLWALREVHRVTAPGGIFIGDAESRYHAALFRRRAQDWADAKRIFLEGLARWPDEGNPAAIRLFTPMQIQANLQSAGWEVLRLYPSDLVVSLVHHRVLEEIANEAQLFDEVLAVELELRDQPHLLAIGRDVQFVARKT